jgi:hypothetical protein
MLDNSFVVTPNVYGPNRPVVIVGSNGSVGFGQADVAPVMDPSGRFTTGYNVTNVRPNP